MLNNILKMKFKEIILQQIKGSKKAKVRTRYNQVPHLTQDNTHGKLTKHLCEGSTSWMYKQDRST